MKKNSQCKALHRDSLIFWVYLRSLCDLENVFRDFTLTFVRKTYHIMQMDVSYTIEKYQAEIDAKAYIEGFRRADYFIKFCQQCKNYGRRYGCPPFEDDPLAAIKGFGRVRLLGVKITPKDKTLPLEAANDLMDPAISELNAELLNLEQALGGRAYGFVGSCPYCGGAPCARIKGKPCKHPDKVRPSLEAIGFDIGKTATDLLGLDIQWSKDGLIPEYLTLICGIFY